MSCFSEQQRKWWVLTGVGLSCFLGYIDFTIVNTALPALRAEMHASVTELQWLVNIFLLAVSAFMVVMGRVADLYGRRRLLFTGAIGFALSSLGAGLATNIYWLIAFRLGQGFTCAILYTSLSAIVYHAFPPNERGKALGWLYGINGVGLAIGPVAGGILISSLGWRWIFLINVPLIALSMAICALSVRESRAEGEDRSLDWAGLVLLIVGLTSALLAISQGNHWGWSSVSTLASLSIAVLMLWLFYRVERCAKSPILKFRLFASRNFIGAVIAHAALAFFYVLAFFLMPLYLSEIFGLQGYQLGLMLLPTTAAVALVSPVAGRLIDKYGPKPVMLSGFACFALSAILQFMFSVGSSMFFVGTAFAFMGIGWACVLGAASVAALSAVPEDMAAVASGSFWTIHNIGGAVGLALGVLCYQLAAESRLLEELAVLGISPGPWVSEVVNDPEGARLLLLKNAGKLDPARSHLLFQQLFLAGYQVAMGLLLGVSLLAWGVLKVMMRRPRQRQACPEHEKVTV